MENIRCYHDKLSDEEVFSFFTTIISKSKKFAKVEFKVIMKSLAVIFSVVNNAITISAELCDLAHSW